MKPSGSRTGCTGNSTWVMKGNRASRNTGGDNGEDVTEEACSAVSVT